MSLTVLSFVLFAALLHASWNACIKFGDDKLQGMILLSVAHGLIGLLIMAIFPAPKPEAWGLLALSVFFHLVYKSFLTAAYMRGDLSRVYPIARGTAPMLVLGFGMVMLDDVVSPAQVAGIILIGFGILLLARGVFTSGESRALLPFALGSALGTAGYSLADGVGARLSGDASGYIGWLFFLDAVLFSVWGFWYKGRDAVPANPKILAVGLGAGVMSVGAYWIAVWAMTIAPIALVTALRETSVLFAVLIGILVLKEKVDRGKILAACVMVLGVVITRF